MSLYAGMLRAGIAMRDCDRTEVGMYLKVLAAAAKRDRDSAPGEKTMDTPQGRKKVVEMRRGTIDQFWG